METLSVGFSNQKLNNLKVMVNYTLTQEKLEQLADYAEHIKDNMFPPSLKKELFNLELKIILRIIRFYKWDIILAAKHLKVSKETLYRKLSIFAKRNDLYYRRVNLA